MAGTRFGDAEPMQNDKISGRPWWVAGAVTAFGSAILCRELIRSGTVPEGLLNSWWGELSQTALAVAAAGTVAYCLRRAYRR